MKHLRSLLLAAGGLLILTACNDENPWNLGAGEGRIVPKVSADPGVTDVVGTRADEGFTVPQPNELRLTLSKQDGSYSSSWESIDLFPTDKAFPVGAYTLKAEYGTEGDEGFERPYFCGSTDFTVLEEETATPSVTASLANCMVSVEYTDDFKNYFKSYTTQLHSKGGSFITFIPGETRPAFLNPGEATVTVNIVKQNGISATLEVAKITTAARHHYHLLLDVNGGETGDAQLVINFDDTLTQEDVIIDLTDDLLLSPEPKVTAHGFTPDQATTIIEGSAPDEPVYFVINAQGGLSAVTLTTESTSLISLGMPAEIDLMAATESQKAVLETLGLECQGIFSKPDKFAKVDLTNLLASIRGTGEHKFSLVVKDKLSKVNLPVTCIINTEAVVLDITNSPGILLGDTEATVTVDYNGSNPATNITVEAMDAYGVWKAMELKSATAVTRSTESYNLTFAIPDTDADVKFRLKYKGTVKASGTLVRSGVGLSAAPADIWATRAVLTIKKNPSTAYSELKFYVSKDGGSWTETAATINESTEQATISGLTPGTSYKVKSSDTGQYEESYKALAFVTETALQPQNGNMDTWSQDEGWQNKTAWVGDVTIYNYFPGESENAYWATRNALTTCKDFGRTSCYYNNYSGTYGVEGVSGQAAEISTVGWAKDGANLWSGTCNNVTAGMLFMGTYSYDYATDTETINLGRPFTSRPASVTFDYKYTPEGSEAFRALVVVENRDNGTTTELARGVFESSEAVSSFTSHTVNLTYSNTGLKATHAYVYFLSTTAASPGHHTAQGEIGAFYGYSDSRFIGSVLNVDNIVFNY